MNGWRLTAFSFGKTVTETALSSSGASNLANYGGEVPAFFEDFSSSLGGGAPLTDVSVYFAAPEEFLRSQINSYGGEIRYTITHSGYEFEGKKISRASAVHSR